MFVLLLYQLHEPLYARPPNAAALATASGGAITLPLSKIICHCFAASGAGDSMSAEPHMKLMPPMAPATMSALQRAVLLVCGYLYLKQRQLT